MNDTLNDVAVAEARERGANAGEADGTTYRVVNRPAGACALADLQAYEDGAYENLPSPLSGENAGESIPELLGDILPDPPTGGVWDDAALGWYEDCGEIEDAYESAYVSAWLRGAGITLDGTSCPDCAVALGESHTPKCGARDSGETVWQGCDA